jgi:FLVCR family feline leukemia virus subgroup C receptor-related protein
MEAKTANSSVSDHDSLAAQKHAQKNGDEITVFHICVPEAESKNTAPEQQMLASTKVYDRRWLMLFIFVMVSMLNAFQWIQFSIITSLLMK